ncbi:MAG TPA: hypothetical protein VFN67_42555 [Polyangiales bacterium]|nr:hypothetical protein [Polyangiales bacterium]
MADGLPLEAPELRNLRESGLTNEEIAAFGARTESNPTVINRFARRAFTRSPIIDPRDRTKLVRIKRHFVLVIPCPQPDGSVIHRIRPRLAGPARDKDKDEYKRDGDTGEFKPAKYISPAGIGTPIFYPRGVLQSDRLADRHALLVLCEGEKKAWLLQWTFDMLGISAAVIGLTGIENAHDVARKELDGTYALRPDLLAAVSGGTGRIEGRTCIIAFDFYEHKNQARRKELDRLYKEYPYASDSEIMSMCKRKPAREPSAAQRIANMLYEVGAPTVRFSVPPPAADGSDQCKGFDDFYRVVALAVRGLTVDQHDLDRDCADTLDHDAGRRAVARAVIDDAKLLYHSTPGSGFGPEYVPPVFVFRSTGQEPEPSAQDDVTLPLPPVPPAPPVANELVDVDVPDLAPGRAETLTAPNTTSGAVSLTDAIELYSARRDVGDSVKATDSGPSHRITVRVELGHAHRSCQEIVRVLARTNRVFSRGDKLVRVATGGFRAGHAYRNATGGLPGARCVILKGASIGSEISRAIDLQAWNSQRNCYGPSFAPDHITQIIGEGDWPEFPELTGVIEVPAVVGNGHVISNPGYDAQTGLYLVSDGAAIPAIGSSRDAARAAYRTIAEFVGEFPFCGEHDRAAFVAYVLTVLGRYAVDGPVPIFAFSAPAPRSGKTHLSTIGSIIGAGYSPGDVSVGRGDELEKTLTSLALKGARTVRFDNIRAGTVFADTKIEQATTTCTWSGRLLGGNIFYQGEWLAVISVTGIALAVGGEMAGRTIPCRIDAKTEHPEDRNGFKRPNIIAACVAEQKQLRAAALTILHAHACAGRPRDGLPFDGDFTAWSDGIAAAVCWASDGVNPTLGRAAQRARAISLDPDAALLRALHGFQERGFGTGGEGRWTSTDVEAQLLLDLNRGGHGTLDAFGDLRGAVVSHPKAARMRGPSPSRQLISAMLAPLIDQTRDGLTLRATGSPRRGQLYWVESNEVE